MLQNCYCACDHFVTSGIKGLIPFLTERFKGDMVSTLKTYAFSGNTFKTFVLCWKFENIFIEDVTLNIDL